MLVPSVGPVLIASFFPLSDDQKPQYYPIILFVHFLKRRFHKIIYLWSLVLNLMLSWNWLWNMNMEKWTIDLQVIREFSLTLWWLNLFCSYCYGSKYLSILKFLNVSNDYTAISNTIIESTWNTDKVIFSLKFLSQNSLLQVLLEKYWVDREIYSLFSWDGKLFY